MKMNRIARLRGFTLIELFVVILVIAVLLALLLPAVQQSREAVRRTVCVSQLKNVGLGIQNHAEGRNAFPAGYGQSPFGVSFLFQILPYLEQTSLYNSVNLSGDVEDDNNFTASERLPGIFLCPSDASRATPESANSTNYAGNAGHSPMNGEGVFIQRPLRASDVTDGLSRTVGVAEWIVGPGTPKRPTRLGSVYRLKGNYGDTRTDRDAFTRACEALGPADIQQFYPFFKGEFWLMGNMDFTLYNHTVPPNQPSCVADQNMSAATAGSLHPGGAHVLTMDGGTHFVKESIDPQVWLALGTRSDAEAVTGPPF